MAVLADDATNETLIAYFCVQAGVVSIASYEILTSFGARQLSSTVISLPSLVYGPEPFGQLQQVNEGLGATVTIVIRGGVFVVGGGGCSVKSMVEVEMDVSVTNSVGILE